jgi:hypothetical protein
MPLKKKRINKRGIHLSFCYYVPLLSSSEVLSASADVVVCASGEAVPESLAVVFFFRSSAVGVFVLTAASG